MYVTCKHCRKWRHHRARGLCKACHQKPGVRDLYEPRCTPGERTIADADQTEAELDALIAAQRETMPAKRIEGDSTQT